VRGHLLSKQRLFFDHQDHLHERPRNLAVHFKTQIHVEIKENKMVVEETWTAAALTAIAYV